MELIVTFWKKLDKCVAMLQNMSTTKYVVFAIIYCLLIYLFYLCVREWLIQISLFKYVIWKVK